MLYIVTSALSLNFLRDQIDAMIDRGVRVVVATNLDGGPSPFAAEIELHDVDMAREPSPVRDVRTLWSMMRLIRRIAPDAVTVASPKAGLLGALAAWLSRVPTRIYVVWGLRFETVEGAKRRVFRWLERLTTAAATDVFYNSASLLAVAERERTVRRGRGRLLGTGNCVKFDRFSELPDRSTARRSLGLGSDDVVIGFIGRLTRDKGIVDLVSAFEASGSGYRLLLVGDFEDGDPVPAETRDRIAGANDIVKVPWLDDPRVAYAAIDVLAFPSLREGLPNVPLEAQRAGVPVVAYAATGTIDAIGSGGGGVLVDIGDHHALWREISALADDPDRRREMGSSGRTFVEQAFDPKPCWDELHRRYVDASG